VRRVLIACVVAILALNVAGIPNLFMPEPCGTTQAADSSDGECLPTCVLCGCCTQPVIPVGLLVEPSVQIRTPAPMPLLTQVVDVDPAEILHVPRHFSV
jgi:hypothetical protein